MGSSSRLQAPLLGAPSSKNAFGAAALTDFALSSSSERTVMRTKSLARIAGSRRPAPREQQSALRVGCRKIVHDHLGVTGADRRVEDLDHLLHLRVPERPPFPGRLGRDVV